MLGFICLLLAPLFYRGLGLSPRGPLLTPLVSSFDAGRNFLYHSVLLGKGPASEKGPPLIIFPGLLGSTRNFATFARLLSEKLANKHDVVVMDLPDHGRTAAAFGALPYDYIEMGKDVLHTLSRLGIVRAHLIGHSAGGKVAASAALTAQQQQRQKAEATVDILSTTLMDISPIDYDPGDPEFNHVITTVEFLLRSSEPMRLAKSKAEAFSIISSSIPDKALQLFLQANLQPVPGGGIEQKGGFEWKFKVQGGIEPSLDLILKWPHHDPLTPLQRPVLIVKGIKSNFVKSSHLPEIAKTFPLFTLATVDAGHWLHVEKPAEIVDIMENFFERVMVWHEEQKKIGQH